MRRANGYLIALLLAAALGLCASPGWASSSSGGSALPGGGSSSPSSPPTTVAQPGNTTVSASGHGITIVTRASTFLHSQLRFSGSIPASDRGDVVEIERSPRQSGGAWTPTVQARAGAHGSFSAVWSTNHIGMFSIRAVVLHPTTADAAAASPTLTVTIYRSTIATLYGPGFWGSRTACGEVLRKSTLGVANRTLPCGTAVSLYFRGRTIVVPVIDRGPYANHANYDLTMATARALRMSGTGVIGAVALARPR